MSPGCREFWVDVAAGWVSGATSVVLSQPVDTVLTRLQMSPAVIAAAYKSNKASAGPRAAVAGHDAGTSRAISLASRILAEGGPGALWRGATPLAMVVPLQNAMLFAGYGVGERWARERSDQRGSAPSLLPVFVGGFTGGVLQSFVVSPAELLKIRQQAHGGSVTRSATALRADLGTPLLWRGLGATLLRDGMPHGVWFMAYEWSKQMLTPSSAGRLEAGSKEASNNILVPLAAGAFAATAAWGVGYPFDTIKTRIQASAAAGQRPLGVLDTAAVMIRETGGDVRRALYRGLSLKLLRALPTSMIGFLVYEQVSSVLS
eukprot:CAMPEP_0117659742 /NCGR_PEP_ID=MMETSP0804-20121206/6594_1 /TAXON_ID=1074897 /ORGANISM="Tetraselmis astigmatica, Strain CCMP880" /LENGTH=317 /DNA_ID=CAMNT_0005466419 /DNA_START=24 /DNA_END=977 /DNA_ORIENTATION=-